MLNTLSVIISPYNLFIFLPELWLSTTVLILLVYAVLGPVGPQGSSSKESLVADQTPKTRTIGQWAQIQDIDNLSVGILGITLILILNQMNWCLNGSFDSAQWNGALSSYNGLIKVDAMICFIKFICILGGLLVIWISKEYYAQEKLATTGHNILILLALLGITLLVSSNDLLALYLAMELQSLSFYTLATLKRDDESSTEAGLKYFILGALSSGIFLFGVSLIYGLTGLTNFDSLSLFVFGMGLESDNSVYSITGLLIGIIFIGIAFLFKLAAAPFHMWVPDVYQGSPTSITALFAIVPKLAIFGVLIRLYLNTFLGLMIQWQPLIIFCSIASMIIGSFGALNQSLIKRLLAYSAISHIGYVLIAFASGTHTSLQALLIYMTIYMIMSIQSFTILLSLRKKLLSGGNGKSINYLIELVSLSRSQPVLAITFAISLLSLAGIPPLAGFFSKWLVFSAAIQSHFYLLAIIGVLTSVLASVYYLRIIINIYARFPLSGLVAVTADQDSRANPAGAVFNLNVLFDALNPYLVIDRPKSLILGWTTFFILFIIFFPTPLLLVCHEVAIHFYL
jgi:NADH-quinone oxidoreductase subunit N